jgi:hypothetical protein
LDCVGPQQQQEEEEEEEEDSGGWVKKSQIFEEIQGDRLGPNERHSRGFFSSNYLLHDNYERERKS